MFGRNDRVGKSFFSSAPADSLLLVSNFVTLQGEGPYRGERCVFQRLAKCNLACSFCDTYFDSGEWRTFTELWGIAFHATGASTTDALPLDYGLVITGGEPMLQANLGRYLAQVEHLFKWTQIESNGTVYQQIPDRTTLVISPKCSEVDGIPVRYVRPPLSVLDRADCLKFVMEAPGDEPSPYSSLPDWAFEWKHDHPDKPIFASPMNRYNRLPVKTAEQSIEERSRVDEVVSFWEPGLLDMAANQRNHEFAARYAVEHGLIFNVQIHLLASLA